MSTEKAKKPAMSFLIPGLECVKPLLTLGNSTLDLYYFKY